MQKTHRGYRKPQEHDQLEQSVHDIAETFEMIDKEMSQVEKNLGEGDDVNEEILWQNIKNTAEISLMKGVTENG